MFQKIVDFLASIFNYLYEFVHVQMGISDKGISYVLAIFIFTLIIRLLILPLNIKSAKSTRGMQKIQPEVKKLQEKYKNDPQKMNEEVMKLYKENNVSLTGGCLPSLLPLPILMALYWVFMGINDLDGVPFLWLKSLGGPDQLFIFTCVSSINNLSTIIFNDKSSTKSSGRWNGYENYEFCYGRNDGIHVYKI